MLFSLEISRVTSQLQGDGRSFEGEYAAGKPSRGTMREASGEEYTGEFNAQGQRHGLGRTRAPGPGGEVIEATWVNGMRQGKGWLRADGDDGPKSSPVAVLFKDNRKITAQQAAAIAQAEAAAAARSGEKKKKKKKKKKHYCNFRGLLQLSKFFFFRVHLLAALPQKKNYHKTSI